MYGLGGFLGMKMVLEVQLSDTANLTYFKYGLDRII